MGYQRRVHGEFISDYYRDRTTEDVASMKVCLMLLTILPLSTSMLLPSCSGGGAASCECGDGSPLDTSSFPPCDISKGRPKCSCPAGESLEAPAPKRIRPRKQGRPICVDDTAVPWQLTCEDGSSPTASPGSPPACAQGALLCMNQEPLMCPDGTLPWSK